jgi:hypothetical protein
MKMDDVDEQAVQKVKHPQKERIFTTYSIVATMHPGVL